MNMRKLSSVADGKAVARARGVRAKEKAGGRIPSGLMGEPCAAASATATSTFELNVPEAVEAIKDLSVVMLRPSRSTRSMKKRRAQDLWEICSTPPSRWRCRQIRRSTLISFTRAMSRASVFKINTKLNKKGGGLLWNRHRRSGQDDLGPRSNTMPLHPDGATSTNRALHTRSCQFRRSHDHRFCRRPYRQIS